MSRLSDFPTPPLRPMTPSPTFPKKPRCKWILWCCFLLALSPWAQAQNFSWGSEVFSDLRDSEGEVLDGASFVFQLGAFESGFTPTSANVTDWETHWMVFDQAAYNEGLGYFTSTASMNADGTSSYQPGGGASFEGLTVYLWVYNNTTLSAGTEWFLGSVGAWGAFPTPDSECCGNSLPIEYSTSDFSGTDQPVWGSQGGNAGNGYYTVTGNHTLQTFSAVPEPSTMLLTALTGMLLAFRRKR